MMMIEVFCNLDLKLAQFILLQLSQRSPIQSSYGFCKKKSFIPISAAGPALTATILVTKRPICTSTSRGAISTSMSTAAFVSNLLEAETT